MARKRKRTSKSSRVAIASIALAAGAFLFLLAPPAETSPAAPRKPGDWPLVLQVRDALADDPVLGKFNLGVRVRDGVVTLQGPVPTSELSRQAMAIVKKIPGVTDVKSELYTPAADDALARRMPHPVTTGRPPTPEPPRIEPTPPVEAKPVVRSLTDQIEQLRTRDRRFETIKVEVRDGRVILRGTVIRSQDAWEFAEQVGRLPGVRGVTQNVATR